LVLAPVEVSVSSQMGWLLNELLMWGLFTLRTELEDGLFSGRQVMQDED
jgi:hypothetical protein